MSQRRSARQAVNPVCITPLLLPPLFGRRTYESFQEEFAGAVHTAEGLVTARARLDIFESPKQILLLYTKHLRTNHREESVLTSLLDSSEDLNIHCTVEVIDHLGRCLRSCPGGPVRQLFSLQLSAHAKCRKGDCLPRRPRLTYSHEYSATHFEHTRHSLFQDIRFFAHHFVCNPVRQRQYALQSIDKTQRDLVILALFFQKLNVKRYLRF